MNEIQMIRMHTGTWRETLGNLEKACRSQYNQSPYNHTPYSHIPYKMVSLEALVLEVPSVTVKMALVAVTFDCTEAWCCDTNSLHTQSSGCDYMYVIHSHFGDKSTCSHTGVIGTTNDFFESPFNTAKHVSFSYSTKNSNENNLSTAVKIHSFSNSVLVLLSRKSIPWNIHFPDKALETKKNH